MEALIHKNPSQMSDFEKVIWLQEEVKQLKIKLKELKNINKNLNKIRSSKQIREEIKLIKKENHQQKRLILDLQKQLLKHENKKSLQELQHIYKQGDEVSFMYNNEIVFAIIKGVHKRFLTLYSFKNVSDGFRLEYSNVI